MNCPKCGVEVRVCGDTVEGTRYYEPVDKALLLLRQEHNLPFYCDVCGAFMFPYQAHNNYAFIYEPLPEQVGSIVIPDRVREAFRTGEGVVLSIGDGYYDKKRKRFIPTEVKVGDKVIYDYTVPWEIDVTGTDGKSYVIKIMPELDIKGILSSWADTLNRLQEK